MTAYFGKCLYAVAVTAGALLGTSIVAANAVELRSGSCDPAGKFEFVCGPVNAEELLPLDGTPWIVASQLGSPNVKKGAISIIHRKSRQWGVLPIDGSAASYNDAAYPGCPSPLVAEEFVGHGMTFVAGKDGKQLLFAINHGKREAVEVFEVTPKGDEVPEFKWVGCLPSPNGDSLNGLAELPDGGIAATVYFQIASSKTWFSDMMQGKLTGDVFEWHPGKGWSKVPDSGMAGANGIVALDDASLIVAEWGAKKVHKISRNGSTPRVTAEITGYPDNIHKTDDGTFLVVAQSDNQEVFMNVVQCLGTDAQTCGGEDDVVELHPADMSVKHRLKVDADPKLLGFVTSALDLGDEIWLGVVRGNRIGIVKK
ncbi:hypothetical protein [Agrobacterium sp. MCAB5]|uniref:hypothetical protein n=1 Tax=Agrobacterium sp. MCAB5 TaxID=3233042 RepID=UPI003F91C855